MKKTIEGKDIVVIGSGIGGLSAGIILSLLDYDVTIVEKNSLPGGLMRSYRRGGIDCPVGVHYVGALGDDEPLGRMFGLLGISVSDLFEKMGQDGIIDRYIFDDFTFDLPVGIDDYENKLLAFFPDDAAAIALIITNMREIGRRMLEPAFILNQNDPFQSIDYLNPMGELLQKLDVSDGLRRVLAMPAGLIGVPIDECPVIFHHMVLAGYLFSSWRLKESGSKMADMFAQRFRELGGKFVINDGAEKILLEGAAVAGLRLQSGGYLPAAAVVAAVHPKVLLGLIEPPALKNSFRERVSSLKETDGVNVVQVGVDARQQRVLNHNIYRLQASDKSGTESGFYFQLRRGNTADVNLLSIIAGSPRGEWSPWENTRSGKRGRDYEVKKMDIACDLLEKVGLILGKIENPRVLDVFTPLTLRDYVNCPEGSCYGVMRSAGQLLKIASVNNIPLAGLYPAGQNLTAPGILGCILGSFNVARQIAGPQMLIQKFRLNPGLS
jgi:all-trans-retinol 13,14-reductase